MSGAQRRPLTPCPSQFQAQLGRGPDGEVAGAGVPQPRVPRLRLRLGVRGLPGHCALAGRQRGPAEDLPGGQGRLKACQVGREGSCLRGAAQPASRPRLPREEHVLSVRTLIRDTPPPTRGSEFCSWCFGCLTAVPGGGKTQPCFPGGWHGGRARALSAAQWPVQRVACHPCRSAGSLVGRAVSPNSHRLSRCVRVHTARGSCEMTKQRQRVTF